VYLLELLIISSISGGIYSGVAIEILESVFYSKLNEVPKSIIFNDSISV
jgi:hypothetical protein